MRIGECAVVQLSERGFTMVKCTALLDNGRVPRMIPVKTSAPPRLAQLEAETAKRNTQLTAGGVRLWLTGRQGGIQ